MSYLIRLVLDPWPRDDPERVQSQGHAMTLKFLWYVPNTVDSGHRGDDTADGWGSLDFSTSIAATATFVSAGSLSCADPAGNSR